MSSRSADSLQNMRWLTRSAAEPKDEPTPYRLATIFSNRRSPGMQVPFGTAPRVSSPCRPANNIAHLAVTDHRIRRPTAASSALGSNAVSTTVVAWREPPAEFRRRDLALAQLQIASNEKLPGMIRASVKMLEDLDGNSENGCRAAGGSAALLD